MRNHYIVCGYGEIGGAICGELQAHQFPFVVITDDDATITALNREGYPMVRGNPTADSSLKEAGVEQAVGVISVLADDADNLFISLAARELNPKILIIARGEESSLRDRILRAGADIVVSPMTLGGRQIAELIKQEAGASSLVNASLRPSGVSGLRLTPYRHAGSEPVTVQHAMDTSNAIGVAALERKDGTFEANPTPESAVYQDDTVVVITRTGERPSSFQNTPSGRTILLADDHRALRLLFARKLTSAGHEVIQATNGDDALRMASAHTPDLIVLDVNMPGRNGYQVCSELRKTNHASKTPIILYSGEQTDQFVQQGQQAGADMCIRKTSKSSDLLAKIEEAFKQRDEATAHSEQPTPDQSNKKIDVQAGETLENRGDAIGSSPLDIDIAMENVDGDRELLNDLLESVLDETPRMMKDIHEAVEKSDYQAVQGTAHILKSAVAIFGASEATTAAENLELAGREQNANAVQSSYAIVATQMRHLVKALQELHADSGMQ